MKTLNMKKTDQVFRHSYMLFFFMTMLFSLHGCAAMNTYPLPSITAEKTDTYHEGKVIWHELLTEDVAAATSFYRELFGWTIQPSASSSDYLVIFNNNKPIGGMTMRKDTDPDAVESLWLVTLSVKDVDKAMTETRQLHGKVLDGPFDVKGRGRMVIVEDSLGAPHLLS